MKIHSFYLMPYPYLPDDFEKQYRSVYIDIPASCSTPSWVTSPTTTTWTRWSTRRRWASTACA
jgi:hypothetical protein